MYRTAVRDSRAARPMSSTDDAESDVRWLRMRFSTIFRKSVAGLFASVVVIGAAEYVMDRSNSPGRSDPVPESWSESALNEFRVGCRTAALEGGLTASVADGYCGCVVDGIRDSFSPAEVRAWATVGLPEGMVNRCLLAAGHPLPR